MRTPFLLESSPRGLRCVPDRMEQLVSQSATASGAGRTGTCETGDETDDETDDEAGGETGDETGDEAAAGTEATSASSRCQPPPRFLTSCTLLSASSACVSRRFCSASSNVSRCVSKLCWLTAPALNCACSLANNRLLLSYTFANAPACTRRWL